MIHSAAFSEMVDDEGRCVGFYVTSDREAKRGLIEVRLHDFLGLMRHAAHDYPSVVRQTWNDLEERWVTWAGDDEAVT